MNDEKPVGSEMFVETLSNANFAGSAESDRVEAVLKGPMGLKTHYDFARLAIGRSLADPSSAGVPAAAGKSPIKGRQLFGDAGDADLWVAVIVEEAGLGGAASLADFRNAVAAHWHRGAVLLIEDWEAAKEDPIRFLRDLGQLLPERGGAAASGTSAAGVSAAGTAGRVAFRVGGVSTTEPGGETVEVCVNETGALPHVALMGGAGKGKTRTGFEIARQVTDAGVPMLWLDPKGDAAGKYAEKTAALRCRPTVVSPGRETSDPIPLDFLPPREAGAATANQAVMRLRDTVKNAFGSVGAVQEGYLVDAAAGVIESGGPRGLAELKVAYDRRLAAEGKDADTVSNHLRDLVSVGVFRPDLVADEFFSRSWAVCLNQLPGEKLRRFTTLLLLDAARDWLLRQSDAPTPGGHLTMRHLLWVDEAERVMRDPKVTALSDLVRQGRSKGGMVLLASQDPGDFRKVDNDFTTQLGTVVAFACNQTTKGLKAMQGPYGRKVQPQEFSDKHLDPFVAFCAVNRRAVNVRAWPAKDG